MRMCFRCIEESPVFADTGDAMGWYGVELVQPEECTAQFHASPEEAAAEAEAMLRWNEEHHFERPFST